MIQMKASLAGEAVRNEDGGPGLVLNSEGRESRRGSYAKVKGHGCSIYIADKNHDLDVFIASAGLLSSLDA